MRRLLLFRHSKSERSEPGIRDPERALTGRGREDAGLIGAYLVRHGFIPDRVLVSTAVRSQETWKHAAPAFRPQPAAVAEQRLYGATPKAILDVIKEIPDGVHTLLVIGHNPGLHELAAMLIASGDIETREQLREKFPTSGLAIIDFAFDDWGQLHARAGRLERFISPRTLDSRTK